MDIKKINTIIDIFKSSGLSEMSLEVDNLKITMKSNKVEMFNIETPNIHNANKELNVNTENKQNGEWIKAPFVGTFYAAPEEKEPPYITVGQKVKEGDVLCILEAMKVMNEIKSNKSGTVLEIKAKNGVMVEFDEELILIGE